MKSLPEITCPNCNLTQLWRGQKKCIHRGCDLKGELNVRESVPTLQTSGFGLADVLREDRRNSG